MKRRNFIVSLPLAGLTMGKAGAIIGTGLMRNPDDSLFAEKSTLEKVTLAMLSMQRATWEQGVAMQAMLELGETELVILMAKDHQRQHLVAYLQYFVVVHPVQVGFPGAGNFGNRV